MLEIKNLYATIGGKEILKGINLTINKGETHAIMGPNGSGKSTLSKVITGDPSVEVTSGDILYEGKSIIDMDVDTRANEGIFLSFQYPVEIPGVNNGSFLRMAYNAKMKYLGKELLDPYDFDEYLEEKLSIVSMDKEYLERAVNHGFSGGEKKRNEMLQMAVLEPKLSILDEVDSGLDIDALKIVASAVNRLKNSENSFLLITHYQRLLNFIVPDHIHVLSGGKIIKSGDKFLALELEESGYDSIK
ncbi:MAG: Fe-S cluster assembly ATPase SufC [Candidatus Cloacimonadota bacterium]|nr:MAG: Fe-S cluster assembly ATPase SufC [Candidatus Cloacimonadota bacterium]PIE81382.1 MAG: Fe-S cluster assembly ATPase SufC [Candidatus Delongbacteria bacterium]